MTPSQGLSWLAPDGQCYLQTCARSLVLDLSPPPHPHKQTQLHRQVKILWERWRHSHHTAHRNLYPSLDSSAVFCQSFPAPSRCLALPHWLHPFLPSRMSPNHSRPPIPNLSCLCLKSFERQLSILQTQVKFFTLSLKILHGLVLPTRLIADETTPPAQVTLTSWPFLEQA